MAIKKKIVEKGSYQNGKVEKYASKSAMAKHEKKESKSFEKKEEIKPKSPMKQFAPKDKIVGKVVKTVKVSAPVKVKKEPIAAVLPQRKSTIKPKKRY